MRQLAGGSDTTWVRHFVEMVLAMMVGMAVLGAVVRGIFAVLGQSGFFLDHPGLRAPLTAMNMTVGMAAGCGTAVMAGRRSQR